MNQQVKHLAIIMDGNRRWAAANGKAANFGHRQGVEALEKVVRACSKLKIQYLTVYALSSENLKSREKTEINGLFSLIREGFVKKLPILKKENVQVDFLGNIEDLPWAVKKVITETKK